MVKNSTKKKTVSIQTMVTVGVMSALVFVLSYISFTIPSPIGTPTRIHLGNIMCLLGGLLFGPWVGGLSAGFGSMIFDLSNPAYASEFFITFINKFVMGFVTGFMMHYVLKVLPKLAKLIISALLGGLSYVALYALKNIIVTRYMLATPWEGVWPVISLKVATSLFNMLLAVVFSVILTLLLEPALAKAGLLNKGKKHKEE